MKLHMEGPILNKSDIFFLFFYDKARYTRKYTHAVFCVCVCVMGGGSSEHWE